MYMYVHMYMYSDIENCAWDSDGMYTVILRIVKAGCHPVAIAQVVEHRQLKSEAPSSILGGCWFFIVL